MLRAYTRCASRRLSTSCLLIRDYRRRLIISCGRRLIISYGRRLRHFNQRLKMAYTKIKNNSNF